MIMKSRDTLIRLRRFQVEEKRRRVAQIEMMIADFASRSRKSEKIIDGGGNFGSALIAMTHHASDPFRVRRTAAHNPRQLFFECADNRLFGP